MQGSGSGNRRALSRRALSLWAVGSLLLGASNASGREFRYVARDGKTHKIAVRRQTRKRRALRPTERSDAADAHNVRRERPAVTSGAEQTMLRPRSPSPVCLLAVNEAAKRFRLPRELILAVISVESSFDPSAVSSSGALGLMQLLPGTARDLDVKDPFDERQNVLGGSRYLRWMLDRFGQDVQLALAAYNVGPSVVERWAGMPALPGPLAYVEKVMRTYRVLVLTPPEWAEPAQ